MALIRDLWLQDPTVRGLGEMQTRLGSVQGKLQVWERDVFGSVKKNLAALRHELEVERGLSIGAGPSRKEKHLMACISELLSREEVMEKQRARMEWLKEGDRNTSFFQAKSRARAKRNRITSLCRDDGSVVVSQEDIEAMATEYYAQLFTAQDELLPELILQHVPTRITEEMNSRFIRPYTAVEVDRALHMIHCRFLSVALVFIGLGADKCSIGLPEWRYAT